MSRDDIAALLPFYVNGTLEPEERHAVAEALEQDEALAAEARALAALRCAALRCVTPCRQKASKALASLAWPG